LKAVYYRHRTIYVIGRGCATCISLIVIVILINIHLGTNHDIENNRGPTFIIDQLFWVLINFVYHYFHNPFHIFNSLNLFSFLFTFNSCIVRYSIIVNYFLILFWWLVFVIHFLCHTFYIYTGKYNHIVRTTLNRLLHLKWHRCNFSFN